MKIQLKAAYLAVLILASSASSFAGDRIGNGGQGVKVGEVVYSFDLYESGLHDQPFFSAIVQADPSIVERSRMALPKGFPFLLVAQKLTELRQVSVLSSVLLLNIMENLTWRLVPSDLIDTLDGDDTPLDLSKINKVQLAVREQGIVRIDKAKFLMMDEANQAALVVHELFYTWIDTQIETSSDPVLSAAARNKVAFVFSEDIEKRGINGYDPTFLGTYPLYGIESVTTTKVLETKEHHIFFDPEVTVKSYPMNQLFLFDTPEANSLTWNESGPKTKDVDSFCRAVSEGSMMYAFDVIRKPIIVNGDGSIFVYFWQLQNLNFQYMNLNKGAEKLVMKESENPKAFTSSFLCKMWIQKVIAAGNKNIFSKYP